GRFSTYLFQIGKHYWLNQRKKFRRDLGAEPLEDDFQAGPLAVSPPEIVVMQQLRDARIRRAIAALPPHYRAAFEMSHYEGLRYVEIGKRLGIPVGTVKSRMAEAVRRLRAELAGDEEGE